MSIVKMSNAAINFANSTDQMGFVFFLINTGGGSHVLIMDTMYTIDYLRVKNTKPIKEKP